MRGTVAKRLRKEAKFKKQLPVLKVIGDYNIDLGYRILNVPKVEPEEMSLDYQQQKKEYKKLKNIYKNK